MSTYVNPGNDGFAIIRNGIYVDKSGLISIINKTINTPDNLTCFSLPRRFGKSFTTQMLCAYYDITCSSEKLFENLEITSDPHWKDHLNAYNVIYIDMTQVLGETEKKRFVEFLKEKIVAELKSQYPDLMIDSAFTTTLINAVALSQRKFVMIIDEWDAPIRETPALYGEYLNFLRLLFKSSSTTAKIFAAVYMTGILPIKKDGSQSAVSNFSEFSILEPYKFEKYIGFSESEVKYLCSLKGRDFEKMKYWYDGYTSGSVSEIYNPYSVMQALQNGAYKSYWKRTSAAETLLNYIDIDFEGLQTDIARLTAGEEIQVSPEYFQNDTETFFSKDDILTLLIHLGYLTYKEQHNDDERDTAGIAWIPNEEVKTEFRSVLRQSKHPEIIRLLRRSDELLEKTLAMDEAYVADAMGNIQDSWHGPAHYHNEQALRSTVKFAYLTAVEDYTRIEELPSGHGIADLVFLPKRNVSKPPMLIELKWNKASDGAVGQIKEKKYPAVIQNLTGREILLVGISYDEKSKGHSCKIEKFPI